jgi:hypothetical protein
MIIFTYTISSKSSMHIGQFFHDNLEMNDITLFISIIVFYGTDRHVQKILHI